MKFFSLVFVFIFLFALLLLGSCAQPAAELTVIVTATSDHNPAVDEIGTAVAATQTRSAMGTAQAQSIATAVAGTVIAMQPIDTATAVQQIVTETPFPTPTFTQTPQPLIEAAGPISTPLPPAPSSFVIRNFWSGMCLDVTFYQASDTAVGQRACNNSYTQKWTRGTSSGGYFVLKYLPSGMCMDIAGGKTPGNGIIQRPCDGSGSQLWRQEEGEGSFFRLKSKQSGQCLDLPGFAKAEVQMMYYDCNYGRHDNQLWIFDPPLPIAGGSQAPALPAGIYVKDIRLDPPAPREKQDVWFHVTFLNTSSEQVSWRWFVYIYRGDQQNPFGQTSSDNRRDGQDLIPTGTAERRALNAWHIVSGDGVCKKYWAKIYRYIPESNTTPPIAREILGANGGPIQKDFQVCP